MKKTAILTTLLILLLLSLAACNGGEDSISAINIVASSFRTDYRVDEGFDYDRSLIAAQYSDGTTRNIKVGKEMLSGFDTATTGNGKELTINYRGKSATYLYNVTYDFAVTVTTRLTYSADEDFTYISIKNPAECGDVCAVSFSIITTNPDKLTNISLMGLEQSYKMSYNIKSDRVTFLIYAADGYTAITQNSGLVRLKTEGEITVSDITVSDGERDTRLPNGIKL